MIDDGLHVVRAFPDLQLSVRAGAFAHDPFNVRHLSLCAELAYLGRDELEQLI